MVGEVKYEHLLSSKFMRFKFPPYKYYEAEVLSVSPLSFSLTKDWLSKRKFFFVGNENLIKFLGIIFSSKEYSVDVRVSLGRHRKISSPHLYLAYTCMVTVMKSLSLIQELYWSICNNQHVLLPSLWQTKRLQNDVVCCIFILVFVFAIHLSTVFTSLQVKLSFSASGWCSQQSYATSPLDCELSEMREARAGTMHAHARGPQNTWR